MKDRIGHLVRRGGGLVRLPGARRRPAVAAVTAATLVIAALAAVSATTTPAASASGRAAHLNSAPPIQARVAQLLGCPARSGLPLALLLFLGAHHVLVSTSARLVDRELRHAAAVEAVSLSDLAPASAREALPLDQVAAAAAGSRPGSAGKVGRHSLPR